MQIDWTQVLVVGAGISTGLVVGAVLFVGVCGRIGKALADREERKFERAIAETPDEVFLFAIRNYDGR